MYNAFCKILLWSLSLGDFSSANGIGLYVAKYLVSNVVDRKDSKIYGSLGRGAFFDLEPSQHGWKEYSNIRVLIVA